MRVDWPTIVAEISGGPCESSTNPIDWKVSAGTLSFVANHSVQAFSERRISKTFSRARAIFRPGLPSAESFAGIVSGIRLQGAIYGVAEIFRVSARQGLSLGREGAAENVESTHAAFRTPAKLGSVQAATASDSLPSLERAAAKACSGNDTHLAGQAPKPMRLPVALG